MSNDEGSGETTRLLGEQHEHAGYGSTDAQTHRQRGMYDCPSVRWVFGVGVLLALVK